MYYDWVWGYGLASIIDVRLHRGLEKAINLYHENIVFPESILSLSESKNINIPLTVQTNIDRKIGLKIFNSKEEKVAQKIISAYIIYGNLEVNMVIDKTILTSGYKLRTVFLNSRL